MFPVSAHRSGRDLPPVSALIYVHAGNEKDQGKVRIMGSRLLYFLHKSCCKHGHFREAAAKL